jgi:hypothetical protein
MKRIYLALLMVVSHGAAVLAGNSVFLNQTTLTTRTNIDASVFVNTGLIYFDLLNSAIVDGTLFQTRDTLNFTNNGTMLAQPGFLFDTVTSTGIHSAASFSMNSAGTVQAVDAPQVGFFALGGAAPVIEPGYPTDPGTNSSVPGSLGVDATNINIRGTMVVGDRGELTLSGSTVSLSSSLLTAGTISELDTNATLGRGFVYGYAVGTTIFPYFTSANGVYDIAWGYTNGDATLGNVSSIQSALSFSPPELFGIAPRIVGTRNGSILGYLDIPAEDIFPFFITQSISLTGAPVVVTSPVVAPNFVSYVYSYATSVTSPVTNYYNVVMVNSAFADPDITASVAFLPEEFGANVITLGDPFATEAMVKFSVPVLDIASGTTVTNSIYFLDSTANQGTDIGSTNTDYTQDQRPSGFEITRTQPAEWLAGLPANDFFDPTLLYIAGEFQNITAPMSDSFYVGEVGRNPEASYGLSDYSATLLGTTQLGLPDLTNEGANITITALKTNNVTNMKLSANGVVNFNAGTLVGVPAATDFGNMSANISAAKGSLLVSNLFPGTFHRLRGAVGAYAATWQNLQTNDGVSTNRVTNYFNYHVLIVDQDLRSSFQTTGLDVALHGSNVVLGDPLRVRNSVVFQATNLAINASLTVTEGAKDLKTANFPGLKNLLIGNNGSIQPAGSIDLGVVPSASPVAPTRQNTPILTITNLGQVTSQLIEFQSQIFANGGTNLASGFGTITINSLTNYLGAGQLGLANALIAGSDVNLNSVSIQVTNSTIMAGQDGSGQLVLQATTELTDHLPNTASTNAYITNLWQVTGGFTLPVKPVKGDLFGTQITTVAAVTNRQIDHVWAGQDLGASTAGFFNNEVIGHLVLERTAPSSQTFHFAAAGAHNAMYVDYLDFEDTSGDQLYYHDMLAVDPNFTIYFANANVDPTKLHQVYSNLVWVPQFAGPNSTVTVAYSGGSNCLMNAALATSSTVDTDGDGTVNLNDHRPLNNPSLGPVPCPSLLTGTEAESVTNGVSGEQFILWKTGQGIVTPTLPAHNLRAGQVLTLTATPAPGWLFLDWSGGVVSSASTVTYTVPTNQPFSFVTANFITNPFIALAGVYNGLFSAPGGVTNYSSGEVNFTLNSQGIFSGKLTIGTTNYPFSSRFNIGDTAAFNVTNGHNVLAVNLQVGLATLTDEATGTVTNSRFSANLIAYHNPVWTTAHPAPQAGTYTLILPGNPNAAASPGGDGYGTVTVDALGNLTAVGTLADGAAFSQSIPVSAEGQWPLYFVPAGVPQPVLGWVTFDTNGAGGTAAGFSGAVTWTKSPGPGSLYTNGFTNASLLLGSIYSAIYQRTNGLGLTSPSITLTGGNLSGTVSEAVNLNGTQTYQSPDHSLTLTINPATGLFTGQYVAPGTSRRVPLAGAVLQNAATARGFFLGTNQSGAVLLQGN